MQSVCCTYSAVVMYFIPPRYTHTHLPHLLLLHRPDHTHIVWCVHVLMFALSPSRLNYHDTNIVCASCVAVSLCCVTVYAADDMDKQQHKPKCGTYPHNQTFCPVYLIATTITTTNATTMMLFAMCGRHICMRAGMWADWRRRRRFALRPLFPVVIGCGG